MRRLIADPDSPDDRVLAAAAAAVTDGLVVAFPTDTLYGLAADPFRAQAMDRLFALKGRDASNQVALVAADLSQVREVADVNVAAARLARAFWPGPLTLVLRAAAGLAPTVVNAGGSVGVRVPAHAVARALARRCGHAVTATSANRSGEPPTADPEDVARTLPELDLLIDAGRAPGGPPSTVIDLTGDAPVLVRSGAVAWDRVLESLASASDPPVLPPA